MGFDCADPCKDLYRHYRNCQSLRCCQSRHLICFRIHFPQSCKQGPVRQVSQSSLMLWLQIFAKSYPPLCCQASFRYQNANSHLLLRALTKDGQPQTQPCYLCPHSSSNLPNLHPSHRALHRNIAKSLYG